LKEIDPVRIVIGSDHRGVELKARLIPLLEQWGHTVIDRGVHTSQAVDYPDIAADVSQRVSRGEVDRGILICGTGIGMAITANKFPGVRAATCHDEFEAEMCRRHNDVNVLCLSSHLLGERNLEKMISLWLNTDFEGGRHARRIEKISQLESQLCHNKSSTATSDEQHSCGGSC
jgi:ribose 5-phosphate isomerase B